MSLPASAERKVRRAIENIGNPRDYITVDELRKHRNHLTMAVIEWRYEEGELGIACAYPRKERTPDG